MGKRIFDVLLSSFGLLVSSPIWLIISLAIKLEDRGRVLYLQERVGKEMTLFKAIKFRSMAVDAEKYTGPVQAIENDPRVSKMGRILRATAMDELPQLINILKGDMSFVGPRALRPEEQEVHEDKVIKIEEIPKYKERLKLRPGLTGLAQVYLPTDAPRRQKFWYDLVYIKKQSFCFDMKLIFLSLWITCKGKWECRGEKL